MTFPPEFRQRDLTIFCISEKVCILPGASSYWHRLVNILKPNGYVMHQQFNILKPNGYVIHQQFNLLKPTGYVMHLSLTF